MESAQCRIIAQADAWHAGSASSHWWKTDSEVEAVMGGIRFSLPGLAVWCSASRLEGCADFPESKRGISGKSLKPQES